MLAPGPRPAAAPLRGAQSLAFDHRMSATLLLIDDDARLAAMVGDYLRASGFQVDVAQTLAAGRARIAARAYDALVLDLMLPDGDGLDLCR